MNLSTGRRVAFAVGRALDRVGTPQGSARGIVLVLHGGRQRSREHTRARQFAVVRMRPFATQLARRGRAAGLAVWRLRFDVRGWNGDDMSPVADARWALDRLHAMYGDAPVALVGHSMGARTALRVAGNERASAVAALAPWTPPDEPVEQLAGRTVLILQGTRDSVTVPAASLAYARRAHDAGARVCRVEIRGERHAMVRRPNVWHHLTTGFVLASFVAAPMPGLVAGAFDGSAPGLDGLRIRV